MDERIVIVGNGLDLNLGLKTSFFDFKKYLEEQTAKSSKDQDNRIWMHVMYMILSDHNVNEFWSDFEANLAQVDVARVSYFFKEQEESWDYDWDEIESVFSDIIEYIQRSFQQWILSCEQDVESIREQAVFNSNSCFINFNYTNTLEHIYQVFRKNIFYIHGNVVEGDKLVWGHNQYQRWDSNIDGISIERFFPPAKFEKIFNESYLKSTDKQCEMHISELQKWLRHRSEFRFRKIKEIYILGHSLGEVDKLYFQYFAKKLKSKCFWKISYYEGEKRESLEQKSRLAEECGIERYQLCDINILLSELTRCDFKDVTGRGVRFALND